MSNEEILNLWDCNKLTCGEAIESARADERTKVFNEISEAFNEHLFDSPMMNPIMTRNDILLFLEELKEKKKNE